MAEVVFAHPRLGVAQLKEGWDPVTDPMPPPTRTVGPQLATVHEHDWRGAGLINSPNGDTIPALCGCGETRRFAVRDEVSYIDEDKIESRSHSASTAIFNSDERRRSARRPTAGE